MADKLEHPLGPDCPEIVMRSHLATGHAALIISCALDHSGEGDHELATALMKLAREEAERTGVWEMPVKAIWTAISDVLARSKHGPPH